MVCKYVFIGFKLCPKNMSKKGSENWDPNWLGYVTPMGSRWVGEKRTVGFADVQFSIKKGNDSYVATRCARHSQYNNTTNPIVAHDLMTKGLTIAVNELVRTQNVGKLIQEQTDMYNKEYKLPDSIYVEVMER